MIVETVGAADDIRVGAIGTAPEAIADHGLWSESGHEVLRTKQTSKLRDHAQHGKVAETGVDPLDALGLSDAGQVFAARKDRGRIFEDAGSREQVIQFGLGKWSAAQSQAGLVKEDAYQTIGIAVGQRTQQHGVHDTENGGVGSHAESQG